jgi:hypothetical protein
MGYLWGYTLNSAEVFYLSLLLLQRHRRRFSEATQGRRYIPGPTVTRVGAREIG